MCESALKSYWTSKATAISPVYSLRRNRADDQLQIYCNRSQKIQTDGYESKCWNETQLGLGGAQSSLLNTPGGPNFIVSSNMTLLTLSACELLRLLNLLLCFTETRLDILPLQATVLRYSFNIAQCTSDDVTGAVRIEGKVGIIFLDCPTFRIRRLRYWYLSQWDPPSWHMSVTRHPLYI